MLEELFRMLPRHALLCRFSDRATIDCFFSSLPPLPLVTRDAVYERALTRTSLYPTAQMLKISHKELHEAPTLNGVKVHPNESEASILFICRRWSPRPHNYRMLLGGRSGVCTYAAPPLTFDCLVLFNWVFWVCSKYTPIIWKNIEKFQFAVQTRCFKKTLLFTLPPLL